MIKLFSVCTFILAVGCGLKSPTLQINDAIVSPSNDSLRIVGRVQQYRDSVAIWWPATILEIRFTGRSVKAILSDENGQNYFNLIVDGEFKRYIRLRKGRQTYQLIDNLSEGSHTVKLIKRTEWDKGKSIFYGFVIPKGTLLSLPPASGRIIEFFGDSITAGYAIEDNSGGDSPDSVYTNNYNSYAAITARHFNADLYCTVKSGIGVLVSWFPLTMPEMYNRLDPFDSTSRWDFDKVQPDVVVINLFQNDSWLVQKTDHPSFRKQFGEKPPTDQEITDAYSRFVQTIRQAYPNSKIICALGSMDAVREGSRWPGYIRSAVASLNDKNIFVHFFPHLAKSGHPRVKHNVIMAEQLIGFIEKNTAW